MARRSIAWGVHGWAQGRDRGEIRLFKTKNLQTAIELAKKNDEQFQSGKRWMGANRAIVKNVTASTNANPSTKA